MILIGGQDQIVIDWASQVLNKRFVQPAAAHGITQDDGLLKGAAIWNDHYPQGNLELTYVGPNTLRRNIMREMARYAFEGCNVSRVTCKTRRDNFIVRKLLPRLGFTFEGSQKRYFGPRKEDDALIFVLMRYKAPAWLWKDA